MNERIPALREKTSKLTTSPGVYIMKDKDGKIIYIGKAKNLKNRVTSYFRETPDHTPKVAKMVSNVYNYDFIVTDSEYEALVLECSLIKQHQPRYNVQLKDDKGYFYIKISDEEYPRITFELKNKGSGTFLGPYVSPYVAKQTVTEVNRAFALPTCKRSFPAEIGKGRPCLNYHIQFCSGVCLGNTDKEEYCRTVAQAVEYIKSGSSSISEKLTAEMETAAENLDFELAARLRDRIRAISRAADTQKIVSDSIRDTDIIGVAENSAQACLSVLIYRSGRLYDKLNFNLGEIDSTAEMIQEFIAGYYHREDVIPKEILVEEELPDADHLKRLLSEVCGRSVAISVPQKGRPKQLVQLAKANAGEYLSFKVGRTAKEIGALEELAKLLGLPKPPLYIEAYDISNLASSSMVAGMVVFENGRPLKKAYKKFSIKDVDIQNDYACMREVLLRRFSHLDDDGDEGFSRLPDLILLDGGKGQVGAVKPALDELGIDVPLFGMVKDNRHRTRAIATSGGEIAISGKRSAFDLVTNIQDEVHRFSINYQRSKHKAASSAMGLTKIKGIGEKKALKLIQAFKTREALRAATAEEIAKAAGVGAETAAEVYNYIQNEILL